METSCKEIAADMTKRERNSGKGNKGEEYSRVSCSSCWTTEKTRSFFKTPLSSGISCLKRRDKGCFCVHHDSLSFFIPERFYTPVFQLRLAFTSSMFDTETHKGGQWHSSLLFHSAQLAVTRCNFPPPSSLPSPYSRTLQV